MIRICEHYGESYTYAHTCPRPRGLASVCVHGQLARQCLTCEHEREIADLKEQVRLLTGRLRDVQRALQGWP